MPYYLNAIHIDCATGTARASINVSTVDDLTGATGGFDRAVSPISPAAQGRLDAIVTDAISYINAKHPGVNLQLRPVNPNA